MSPHSPAAQASHEAVLELIATSIDFPLDSDEEALVARHLARCRPCSDAAVDLDADAVGLRGLASVHPPARVASALVDAGASSRATPRERASAWSELGRRRLAAALAGAAGLAVLALLAQPVLR